MFSFNFNTEIVLLDTQTGVLIVIVQPAGSGTLAAALGLPQMLLALAFELNVN